MKRNLVIATVAVAALIGGGTAFAVADDDASDSTSTTSTSAAAARDDDRHDDDRDDRGDRDDDRDDRDDRDDDSDDRDDRDDRDDDDVRHADLPKVTAADAIAAALKHTPGAVVSVDLDDEDDDARKLVWEVEVLTKNDTTRDVHVDPSTGRIL